MTSADLSTPSPTFSTAKRNQPPLAMRVLRQCFAKLGPVFPDLMGRFAVNLWFSTRRKPQSKEERLFLTTAEDSYSLNVAGNKVPVYVWGEDGPVILLVHGWEGRTVQFRHLTTALLAKGFRVIGFDAPGHGNAEGSRTNIEEIHYCISQIAHNYGPIHGVLAHSFGGVSTSFAMRHGLKPQRVVLVNSACDYRYVVSTFQSMLNLPEKVTAAMVARTRKMFAHWPQSMEATMNVDQNAPRFDCPALVIHDLDDPVVLPSQGKRIAATWPGAVLHTTQGFGHSKILAAPEVVKKITEFFL